MKVGNLTGSPTPSNTNIPFGFAFGNKTSNTFALTFTSAGINIGRLQLISYNTSTIVFKEINPLLLAFQFQSNWITYSPMIQRFFIISNISRSISEVQQTSSGCIILKFLLLITIIKLT